MTGPHRQFRPHAILVWLLISAAATAAVGCKVTADDIEHWKGTVKGPGKMVAVMLSPKYPLEHRTHAALALVEMERSDVEGVVELQRGLQRLDETTRAQIIDGLVPGLQALMRGGDVAQAVSSGRVNAAPQQIRAKDAAFLLVNLASPATKRLLTQAIVSWYVVDFNGRNLAGSYSAEQVIRGIGADAASLLVDAMNADMPAAALVKIAELIGQLADLAGKRRAGARLVAIENEMESAEFLAKLAEKIRTQLAAQSPGAQPPANLAGLASLNRERAILDGALSAMKSLASQPDVAERLLAIADQRVTTPEGIGRRRGALQALEGNVQVGHLARLLPLALGEANPDGVRDDAFDRIGDIGSSSAVAPMWPLVQDPEKQRLRWRAGELILHLGGTAIVPEFLSKLPVGPDVDYEPEELDGYATRMSQMTPIPSVMAAQLGSPNWWNRVIAIRFFEKIGGQSDVAGVESATRDTTPLNGERWPAETRTVGSVATEALAAMRERLSTNGSG